jgi:hypothetical protein
MATIGLDKLYYAKITEAEDGEETYDTPVILAKAISAELSVELAEATLYADDGASEVVKDFKSGKLTLGVDDIGITCRAGSYRRGSGRQRRAHFRRREHRPAGGDRLPCPAGKRQVPVFLAVPRYLRHSCRQLADQRATPSPFPRPASRARSCAATNRIPRERTRGRRRFPRVPRA